MDFDKLIPPLKEAHQNLEMILEKENEVISKEINALMTFAKKIMSVTPITTINNERCLLIYKYDEDNKELVDHEVYLTESGLITYRVLDEKRYRSVVPHATIKNGYTQMELRDFLKYKTLEDICTFVENRPNQLISKSAAIAHRNTQRLAFINELNEKMNDH